jgi:hypothetical protein
MEIVVPTQKHDLYLRPSPLNVIAQLESVHLRHLDVGEYDIDFARFEDFQGIHRGVGRVGFVLGFFDLGEYVGEGVGHVRLVIHDQ